MSETSPIHALYLHDGQQYVVEGLEVEDFHGQPCYSGIATDFRVKPEDWRFGLKMYLPVSKVESIIEYPSIDNLRTVMKSFYDRKAGNQDASES